MFCLPDRTPLKLKRETWKLQMARVTQGDSWRQKKIQSTVDLICTRIAHSHYLSPAKECEIVWPAGLTQPGPQFSQALHFRNILNSILKGAWYLPGVEDCSRAQLLNTISPRLWHV